MLKSLSKSILSYFDYQKCLSPGLSPASVARKLSFLLKTCSFLNIRPFHATGKLVTDVTQKLSYEDGVLIVDDTIENKPHTQESELSCWHHDHQSNKSVNCNFFNLQRHLVEIE